ncbi:hypothetical protein AK830_g9752 [Neonectria ditissima]|uniref:BRCT domain-containing protein n=1 Tax=Neonectria ditissima TaxID=78410 RepID=A0A0P7B8L4_9HYPO|nr:hypothetical protein AK830_g9752 [Neonectria ditissima]
MPRQIFKNRVIASAGVLPGQLTVDNLKRWSQIRKGHFTEDFDEDVTHLLCTREQFNKKVPRVKQALKRGKGLHIVHYDWFEFSTVQEKRQPERDYSMRNILAKQNALRGEEARIEKGKKDGEKFVNTTKFLKKRGNGQPSYHRPSPCSGKWRAEMDLFMEFFRIKTGIDWEDRVIKTNTMASSFFQYSPPVNAELRGLPWPPVEEVTRTSENSGDGTPLAFISDKENDASRDAEMEDCKPTSEADDECHVPEEQSTSSSQEISVVDFENSSAHTPSSSVSRVSSPDESCPSPRITEYSKDSQPGSEIVSDTEHSQNATS